MKTIDNNKGKNSCSNYKNKNKRNKIIYNNKSKCPVSDMCGGCCYIDMEYSEQLKLKQESVSALLTPFCKADEIVGMENPLFYRNKVHAVFTHKRDNSIISGVYKEGTHFVVPVEKCFIENEQADEIIATIRKLLVSFKIKTYNEDTGYGLFRHVLIRTAHSTGEIMVVLVTSSAILPSKNNFVKALLKEHPNITSIVMNINDKNTSMVLGDREIVLFGKGYIEDILCGMRFRIGAKSFYQINSIQTKLLYEQAMEYAQLTGKETVIDAYCGIGTIGIVAAKNAKKVIGIELNKDAVKDAVKNAKLNEVKNIEFYNNDAGKFMVGYANSGDRADVVFMDPPRAGSTEQFMDNVITLSPDRIIYISCCPQTLARDLKYLTKRGYKAVNAKPFDMFPMTKEVETIVKLKKI